MDIPYFRGLLDLITLSLPSLLETCCTFPKRITSVSCCCCPFACTCVEALISSVTGQWIEQTNNVRGQDRESVIDTSLKLLTKVVQNDMTNDNKGTHKQKHTRAMIH